MKKVIVIAIVLAAFGLSNANAQTVINSRTSLKGPKAKNHKPWNNTYENKSQIVSLSDHDITGPKAKNTTPADITKSDVSLSSKGGERLMGPKAKNQKH